MEWIDEGIVLGVKRHGETSVILELMTQERGRHLGLVRGGSRRAAARRAATGEFAARHLAGAARRSPRPLCGRRNQSARRRLSRRGACRRTASPISPPCAGCSPNASRMRTSMHALETILDKLDDPAAVGADDRAIRAHLSRRARFRPRSASCAATGTKRRSDLRVAALRPRRLARRRRGVSRQADAAAAISCATTTRLLSAADLADAFALTGFFLDRHAFAPRGLALPDARARFVAAVLVRAANRATGPLRHE